MAAGTEVRESCLGSLIDLVVQIPHFCQVLLKGLFLGTSYIRHGDKGIHKLPHSGIDAFLYSKFPFFCGFYWVKEGPHLRSLFPVPIEDKVLVDEVGYFETEQYFIFDCLFPFLSEDDNLKKRDVVLLGCGEGTVEVETVGKDDHGLPTVD